MKASVGLAPADVCIVGQDWDGLWDGCLLPAETRSLWYFGNDYVRFKLLSATLPSEIIEGMVGDIVNAVAWRIRRSVIDSDINLASRRFPISWLASDIAEPNPYVCDFYLDLCRGIALVEAVRAGGKLFVVVDDDALGRSLADVCRRAGITVRWQGPSIKSATLFRAIKENLSFLRAWLRERRAISRHGHLKAERLKDTCLWFLTWAGADTFPSDVAVTRDGFFGLVPSWLREQGLNTGFLANPMVWVAPVNAIARNVAESATPAGLIGSFSKLSGVVLAYAAYFAFPFAVRRNIVFEGIDLSPLVRLAISRVMASSRLLYAALYSRLAQGLKQHGFAPRVVMYTYENQPWEKTMLAGFRRDLPGTVLVGVQHAPIAERFLSGHPSTQQWNDGSAPDILVTIGEEFRERLITLGAKRERLMVGGAIRHPKLYGDAPSRAETPSQKSNIVLASCPADVGQAVELLHKGAQAILGMEGVEFVANFHPHTGSAFRNAVKEKLSLLGVEGVVRFVEGTASDWLERASVLLYNSSTTCFEAAAAGVPAIYVGPSTGLDLDNMPDEYPLKGRRPETIRKLIERILTDPAFASSQLESALVHFRRCIATPKSEMWAEIAHHAMAIAGNKAIP